MPKSVTDLHETNDLSLTASNLEYLFTEFKEIFSVLTEKLFKGICVPDWPVSSKRTRQTASVSTTPEAVSSC